MKIFLFILIAGFINCNSTMKQDQGIERTSFEFIKGICFKDRNTIDNVVDEEQLIYNLARNTNAPFKLNDFYDVCYLAYSPWKIQKQNFEKLRDSFSMKDCRYNVNLISNDSAQVKAIWNCVYDKIQKDSIELSLVRKEKWLITNIKLPRE